MRVDALQLTSENLSRSLPFILGSSPSATPGSPAPPELFFFQYSHLDESI